MCIFGFAFCKSGTTFHSFRRVRVCVCLVGFASLQSPWAHTLKASLPCSLLPLHLILPSPTTIAKGQQPLSPHQHSCLLMNALLVLHPHYPLVPHQPSRTRTIPCFAPTPLPPLSKVRCCRPKKFGRLPEGLPHYYPSPCTNPSKTALSLALHHHACFINTLFV